MQKSLTNLNSRKKKRVIIISLMIIVTFVLFFATAKTTSANPMIVWGIFKILEALKITECGPTCVMAKVGAFLITGLAFILGWLFSLIYNIANLLTGKFFDPTFYIDTLLGFSTNPAIVAGWKTTTSVVNLFFIVILLFIGVGTLLRIEKYNYKKLLLKLVIAALLTNFSLVLSGVILDFANVLMFSFGDPMEKLNYTVSGIITINNQIIVTALEEILKTGKDITTAFLYSGAAALGALFIAISAITILALAAILLVRVVALWFYLVLSPFAYVSTVLPDTQGISNKWWNGFLRYAMVGPLVIFFVFLSVSMIEKSIQLVLEKEKGDNNIGYTLIQHIGENPAQYSGEAKNVANRLIKSMQSDKKEEQKVFINFYFFITLSMIFLWGGIVSAAVVGVHGANLIRKMSVATVAASSIGLWKLGTRGPAKIGRGLEQIPGRINAFSQWMAKKGYQPKEEADKVEAWSKKGKAAKGLRIAGGALSLAGGTLSGLEPLGLSRGIVESYKRTMGAVAREDEEARKAMADIFLHPFKTASRGVQAGVAHSEGIKKQQAKKEGEIANIKSQIEEEKSKGVIMMDQSKIDSLSQEIEKKKAEIAELNEGKGPWAAIKSGFGVLGTKFGEAAFRDRERAVKVKEYQDRLESITSGKELGRRAVYAITNEELEAVLKRAASLGPDTFHEVLGEIGYSGEGNLQKLLTSRFADERVQIKLGSEIEHLMKDKKDAIYGNIIKTNPVTGKREFASAEEQTQAALKRIPSLTEGTLKDLTDSMKESKAYMKGVANAVNKGNIPIKNPEKVPSSVKVVIEKHGGTFSSKPTPTTRRPAGFVT